MKIRYVSFGMHTYITKSQFFLKQTLMYLEPEDDVTEYTLPTYNI